MIKRVTLERVHKALYDAASSVIKATNPCEISNEDGQVTCRGSRAGLVPANYLCCTHCEHHDVHEGCTVRSLTCRVWLCHHVESKETFVSLRALRTAAHGAGINMMGIRTTMEQEVG